MRNDKLRVRLFRCGLAGAIASIGVATPSHSQGRDDWASREFGIGVVRYADMYHYEAEDIIYASPNDTSDTVAILKREDLCLTSNSVCVRSYERMIEFDYEVPGFAILGFTPDSGWAQVTLDPSDRLTPPTGWVRLLRFASLSAASLALWGWFVIRPGSRKLPSTHRPVPERPSRSGQTTPEDNATASRLARASWPAQLLVEAGVPARSRGTA